MIPELGEIKAIRRKLSWTQQRLSKESGVSQSMIAKIEARKIDPGYTNAVKIFNALYAAENEQETNIGTVMQKKILSVGPESRISKAIELMKKHGVSQLPVIKKGQAVGLISEGNILDALLNGKHENVVEIMQEPPPVVSQNATTKVVTQLLRYYPLVLVTEKGVIKGLITKADLLGQLR